MSSPTLSSFLDRLDSPQELQIYVEINRQRQDLDQAVLGFIALYDSFEGDTHLLQQQLAANKRYILQTLPSKQSNSSHLSITRMLKYAAVILVLLASSLFIYYQNLSKPMVLTSVYKDPGILNFMGENNGNSLETIMFYYRSNEFEKAGELLDEARIEKPQNDTLLYYASLVSLNDKNYREATAGFKKLDKTGSLYSAKALYFRGICCVEQKQYPLAYQIFSKVANSSDASVASYAREHIAAIEKYLQDKPKEKEE